MSGRLEGGGRIDAGPGSFEAAAGAEWGREVHFVRDASGTPIRLEVTEPFGVGGELGAGSRFLGTGSSVESGLNNQVVNSQVFDLSDPAVAARFGTDTDSSSLYDWAKDHASLGGQTVTIYRQLIRNESGNTQTMYTGSF